MPVRARGRRGDPAAGGIAAPPAQVVCGRAYLRGKLQPVEIGIDDSGRIARIARSVEGGDRMDFGDAVLMPAATDLHVHLRDPGLPGAAENFRTGTLQAALGGIGLVGDMPNNEPPMNSLDRLEEKRARARGRISVDLLLYGALVPGRDPARLAPACGAFKLYLSPTTAIEAAPTPAEASELLARAGATGLPISVHAEDPAAFDEPGAAVDLDGWDHARPVEAERDAIEEVLAVASELRVHIAHVTTAELARRIRSAGLSCEATPHHLLLRRSPSLGTRGKVNPPLRSAGHREALFAAFAAGEIPILASDHAPHSIEAKDRAFPLAPSGVPGLETMLPLLLEQVRRGQVEYPRLLAAACDRPARWLGSPRGRIAVGHWADLLVLDFRQRRRLTAATLHAPCGWTPFEGQEAVFPRAHLRRGVPIVRDGEYVGRADGEVERPEFAPPPVAAGSPRWLAQRV
jgi:dihydroorotase